MHLAWFQRQPSRWLGEWAGYLPHPGREVLTDEDTRHHWLTVCAGHIGPGGAAYATDEDQWDVEAWEACPPGGAVCVNVTAQGWPVGDYCYHRWDELQQDVVLGPMRQYIEVRTDTLDVVANQASPRPLRDAVSGQRVFDITGSPLAAFHGHIWGRFVWIGARWVFAPVGRQWRWSWRHPIRSLSAFGRHSLPAPLRRALAAAPVDLPLVFSPARKEPVWLSSEPATRRPNSIAS